MGADTATATRPSYLAVYGDFIAKNAGAVSQIESALRSLTYIVPGAPLPPPRAPARR